MATDWKQIRGWLTGSSETDQPVVAGPPAPDVFGPPALGRIQRIARDSVLEPFAVHRNLETLKKTRQAIETGVRKLGQAAQATGSGLRKTGEVVRAGWGMASGSRWGTRLKGKLKERIATSMPAALSSAEAADWGARIGAATATLKQVAQSSYSEASQWANTSGIGYLEDGFRLLLDRDGERWVLKRAASLLGRDDLRQLEDVRALTFAERERLIAELYPYRNPLLKKYIRALDQAYNVSLGAVVASNLPGTGAAVGALNIVKTILKIGSRLSTMASLYGGRVSGPGALFRVSAALLKSLEAWESDPEHSPLDPDVLDGLFVQEESSRAFREMLEAAVRKDAYIVVPGVGTVGVGKIPLDDFRMNVYVRRLAMNYFERPRLRELAGEDDYERLHGEFAAIYRRLLSSNALEVLHERARARRPEKAGREKWVERWQALAGTDGIAEEISDELDTIARQLQQQSTADRAASRDGEGAGEGDAGADILLAQRVRLALDGAEPPAGPDQFD